MRGRQLSNVSFMGRLATYRYLDMDQVIGEALDFGVEAVQALLSGTHPPAFSTSTRSK
jgi:UDP-galactopyranose mutase